MDRSSRLDVAASRPSPQYRGAEGFQQKLPVPPPLPANRFAGMSKELQDKRDAWYRDVAVLAYPRPEKPVGKVSPTEVKTLQRTDPYSIQKDATRYISMDGRYEADGSDGAYQPSEVIDLTDRLQSDGTLLWDVPPVDGP